MFSKAGPRNPNYKIKHVEPIAIGADVQARVMTLAPADVIPWHHHSEETDHYFVLRGALTIETRAPTSRRVLRVGDRHQIAPGLPHSISNAGTDDCEFLLIQGVGKYDWIKDEA
jgi:quercetin dioxygenase-like cupin family protein